MIFRNAGGLTERVRFALRYENSPNRGFKNTVFIMKNTLNMRREPRRGAKLAAGLRNENSSIHYLSILNGTTRGIVWTDSAASPHIAVIYSCLLGGFQIMGAPPQSAEDYAALRLFFENTVFPQARDEFGLEEFAYSADTEELSDMMRVVLFDKELFEQKQLVYRTTAEICAEGEPVFTECGERIRIERATERFFRDNAEAASVYLPEIAESFKNLESFLKHGFAFFALDGENVCGNLIANGAYGGSYTVGADTKTEYRRRGIASALLRAAVKFAQAQGGEIIWECAEENLPSVRTVEGCGLKRCGEFNVRWFEFDSENNE